MRVKFGKGTYYLGDICYVMIDKIYDEIWGKKFNYDEGEFKVGKTKFAVHRTQWGDGSYEGSNHFMYGVDAGVIGIVPKELWKASEKDIKEYEYGTIHKVEKELIFEVPKPGIFKITIDNKKPITIHT